MKYEDFTLKATDKLPRVKKKTGEAISWDSQRDDWH